MLNKLKSALRPSYRLVWRKILGFAEWRQRSYAAPSPKPVKDAVLLRQGVRDATWVETGTFLGETTALLARAARHVYTIEPADALYERAAKRFARTVNVTVLHKTSEAAFDALLPTLSGPVNFWLDGHFSAGATYQGGNDTPIREELRAISRNLARISPVCVLVDDIRCFDPALPDYATYPGLDYLVDWAREHDLHWEIEHDIFVARTRRATD
jgi:hypothetical protein